MENSQNSGQVVVMQSVKNCVKNLDNATLIKLMTFYSVEAKTVASEIRWRADNGLLKESSK